MPMFQVCVVETREYIHEIEAEDADEAAAIALDEDTDAAVRDSFRERTVDWTDPL